MEDKGETARQRLLRHGSSTQETQAASIQNIPSPDDYHNLSDEEARLRFRGAAAEAIKNNPHAEQKISPFSKLANFFFGGGTRK